MMDPPIGHTLRLSISLRAPMWYVGPGWAAVGGALAAGVFSHNPAWPLAAERGLLVVVLVWLLADALLGTVWESAAGPAGVRPPQGRPVESGAAQPLHWLPYTRPDSPAWWLAEQMGRWRAAWRRPSASAETPPPATLVGAIVLALTASAVLGPAVVALVVLSLSLAWLVARWPAGHGRVTGAAAVRAAGTFAIPWLIGCFAVGMPGWQAVLPGVCLAIAWVGMQASPARFRLLSAGQLALVALLVGLHQPLAASVVAVALVVQWRLAAALAEHESDSLHRAVQPLFLAGLLVGALAVGA